MAHDGDDGSVADSDAFAPGVSSFQSLAAESDTLAKQGDFAKAVEGYTKALALRPMDKNALVARSRCQLKLGNAKAALLDAEATLKEDPAFFKVLSLFLFWGRRWWLLPRRGWAAAGAHISHPTPRMPPFQPQL